MKRFHGAQLQATLFSANFYFAMMKTEEKIPDAGLRKTDTFELLF